MNLQGKLSGLKGLVSHSHSKRRFKGDLTLDMISPPLGDFRHTMHVGRGGDVFGDTSFLSNHGGKKKDNGNAGGDTDSNSTTPDNKIGAFFSRTLRQVRKGSTSESRPGSAAKEQLSPPPPPVSPIVKNAISLPRLDVDVANGSPTTKVLFPKSPGSPEEETKYSYGLESGFVTLPRLSRTERQQPSISRSQNVHRGSLTDATDAILSSCPVPNLTSDPDVVTAAAPVTPPPPTTRSDSLPSLTSLDFTFDLGPSLMSEVFGLIDSPYGHSEGPGGHAWEGEEAGSACGLTNEGSEMDSATISYVDSLQREDCGGGKSPCGGEWGEEEEGRPAEGVPLKGTVPDVAMVGSPGRERVGLESDKFQSAADALARHYSGSSGGGQGQADAGDSEAPVVDETRKKTSYSYDEEEEIKV